MTCWRPVGSQAISQLVVREHSYIGVVGMTILIINTKCIHTAKITNDFNLMQEDPNIASYWSVSSKLSFNCVKCAVLHFWCNNNSTAQYLLNNNIIDSNESIKDLGIMITSDLSWSTQFNMVVSRAYKQLGLIRHSFKTNCIPVKKKLYISLVRSQLMYCSQIWCQTYKIVNTPTHVYIRTK